MDAFNSSSTDRCRRCETLPDPVCRTGMLYVSPPMGPTSETLKKLARDLNLTLHSRPSGILGISLTPEIASGLCTVLHENLSQMELDDTRCLFLGEDETLDIDALAGMSGLGEFLCVLDNRWFIELLEEARLVSWFQPIVRADRPDEVFAYECLIRGKGENGEIIFPPALFDTARRSDLLFYFDRLCRQTAIRTAWEKRIGSRIFINFNPTSIYNPVHCLKSTLEAIHQTGIPCDHVVFEVVETDRIQDIAHLMKIVDYYKRMGFQLALDDLGAGFSSLNLLHQIHPDYIKIDLELIRDVHKDRSKGIIVKNLLTIARDLGIRSIAEGVASEEEWQWLVAHGADLLQGYLFAKPAPEPPVPRMPGAGPAF